MHINGTAFLYALASLLVTFSAHADDWSYKCTGRFQGVNEEFFIKVSHGQIVAFKYDSGNDQDGSDCFLAAAREDALISDDVGAPNERSSWQESANGVAVTTYLVHSNGKRHETGDVLITHGADWFALRINSKGDSGYCAPNALLPPYVRLYVGKDECDFSGLSNQPTDMNRTRKSQFGLKVL